MPNIDFIIGAKRIELAPDPGIHSGIQVVWRFARYSVTKVCGGTYQNPEIVVGHINPLEQSLLDLPSEGLITLAVHREPRPLVGWPTTPPTPLSQRKDVIYSAWVANRAEEKPCLEK
jgi:hypothetical protein